MKLIGFLTLVFTLILSCKSERISPQEIVSVWKVNQKQTKNANGNWSEWSVEKAGSTLSTIEFTLDGKILWNGVQSDNCCTPQTYSVKDKNILTYKSGNYNCELVSCMAYKDWIIEKLTKDTLVINHFYNRTSYLKGI